jgi:hypothetical protein
MELNANSNTNSLNIQSKHPLHSEIKRQIIQILKNYPRLTLYIDPACDGDQNLPFFLHDEPSNKTEIANVDLMITKNDKVVLVCEIEESDRKPVRLFGKFFTLFSSEFCKTKHKESKAETKFCFCDKCIFLQIVSNKGWTAKSKKGTNLSSKIDQCAEIEKSIKSTLLSYNPKAIEYILLTGEVNLPLVNDFAKGTSNQIELSRIMAKL